MSGKYDDRLADYVDVKERVRLFYAAHPDGRLCTAEVRATSEPDGVPRVWVEAAAYRSPDDPLPGRGWSWMILPGTTPYTRGSELENVETSAWGRAIGALGIGIDKSIASGDEIRAKAQPETKVERSDDGGLIGTVEVGDKATSDFLERRTPEGPVLGFRLRGEKGGILVECHGTLADQLYGFRDAVIGKRVTVWGALSDRSFTPKDKRDVTYQVLAAIRVRVPEIGDLPADTAPTPEPAHGPMQGLTEAESEALWAGVTA
jgi:hypothetical protein